MPETKEQKAERKRKLDGNFTNDEEYLAALEKSWEEAQSLIGKHSNEVGQLRTKTDELSNTVQQYAQWSQQVQPYVNWINQNQEVVQRMMTNPAATHQSAPDASSSKPTYSLLTEDEKKSIFDEFSRQYNEQYLTKAFGNYSRLVEDYAKKQADELEKRFSTQSRAQNEILWKGLERVLPKENLDNLRSWHQEALKYADVNKLDPLQVATEALENKANLSRLQQELDTMRKDKEERDKALIPSLASNNGSNLFAPSKSNDQPSPQSRDDQLAAALKAVEEEHGPGSTRTLFPGHL